MRALARLIDKLLRQRNGVYEFSSDSDCIFRIQLRQAPHGVNLQGHEISKGDLLLGIHIWNEHMPKLPADGADLRWALISHRLLLHSFKLIACEMQSDRKYADIRALFGISGLFSFSDHTGGMRMMQHFGFTVLPYHPKRGRFGLFWQNFFSWWLMYTYNHVSLHTRDFWRLQRTEIWMLADDFVQRYGNTAEKQPLSLQSIAENTLGSE
jgi:hypothetical protein